MNILNVKMKIVSVILVVESDFIWKIHSRMAHIQLHNIKPVYEMIDHRIFI